jgi:hypothetical protein
MGRSTLPEKCGTSLDLNSQPPVWEPNKPTAHEFNSELSFEGMQTKGHFRRGSKVQGPMK